MNTTTNYQTDDQKGRELFKTFCQQQPEFTFKKESKSDFSKWDVSYTSKGSKFIGEIKVRDYDATTFGDWFMQADKLEALQELQKAVPGTKISYINIFNDNLTYIWHLDEIDWSTIKQGVLQLQKNDYDNEVVWKSVYYLPHSLAHKFETEEAKSIFKPLMDLKAKYQMEEDDDKLPF
jgi:hypothetical protein